MRQREKARMLKNEREIYESVKDAKQETTNKEKTNKEV